MPVTVAVAIMSLLSAAPSVQDNDAAIAGRSNAVASCQADVTGDGLADVALLLETGRGQEAVVLVGTSSGGYDAVLLFRGRPPAVLRCARDAVVRETTAGRRAGRIVQTPGAYVALNWPESASVAYVWEKNGFTEIWTSD